MGAYQRIDHYSFGNISVGGKTYTSDLIILPDAIIHPWRRQEGHFLHIDDLKDVIGLSNEVLIIGTGVYGRMHVPDETIRNLNKLGIQINISITPGAVHMFNSISKYKKTTACLHLSC